MIALRDLRLVTLILAMTCAPVGAVAANSEGVTHRVLAIHSYSQDYPWTSGQHSSFIQTLENGLPNAPTVKTEYLDTKRKALDDTYSEEFVRYLRVKYQEFAPDAIYVTDDNALNFSLGPLANLYPNVPIFFSGVNDFSHLGHIDQKRVTGVFEEKEILLNLELLRQTFSRGNRITVVGDGSVTYRAIEESLKKEIGGQGDLELDFIVSDRLDSIEGALSKNRHFPVLLTTLGAIRGDDGKVLSLDKIISGIVQSGSKIIISTEDVYIFGGVLGGYVTSSLAQGSSAANLLLKYFSGIPLSDLSPITRSPNEYVLDDRVLESLNVDLPAKIKAAARLLHPRRSFYDLYKNPILGSLVLLCVALFVSLAVYLISLRGKNRLLRDQRLLLEERRAQLSLHIKNTPLAATSWDENFCCVQWNKGAEKIFGYTEDEAIGRHATELVFPESVREEVDQIFQDLLKQTGGSQNRNENSTKDGRIIVCEWYSTLIVGLDGKSVGVACLAQDITERIQAETELKRSEAWFRTFAGTAPMAIGIKDLDRRFVWANDELLDWMGTSLEALRGKSTYHFQPKEIADNILRLEEIALSTGKPQIAEREICLADGVKRFEWSARFAIFDDENVPMGFGGIGIDVTDRTVMGQQLLQAQKMEVVGQLTGGVAHDFNNLLQIVQSNLEIALDKIPEGSKAEELVNNALRAGQRGATLTQQLLAFSRKQTLRPERCDIRLLVNGITALWSRTLGEDILIKTKFADGLANVMVDENGLTNALLNLAVNARAAMPNGGALTVAVSQHHLATDIAIENDVLAAGDYLEIAVTDTGCGISEENLSHVLEPFFTTKEVGEGSGLGLSMVYGFARQSGGNATIESEPGKGTTVRLLLPVAARTSVSVYDAQMGGKDVRLPIKVLLVEDDADVRASTVMLLKSLGCEVVEAENAAPITSILEQDEGIDLLLSDVVLPGGINGIELAEEAVRLRPDLKVILVSGYPEGRFEKSGLKDAGFPLLGKPFSKKALSEALASVMER